MDYPPLHEAVNRFRLFLDSEGHRGPIQWVTQADALLVRGSWIIRPRFQATVIEEIAAAYQRAVCRRLGVKLGVLCGEGDVLWCYAYCPADQTEAEHRLMPDGLKLSVRVPLDPGCSLMDEDAWDRLQPQDQSEFKHQLFM